MNLDIEDASGVLDIIKNIFVLDESIVSGLYSKIFNYDSDAISDKMKRYEIKGYLVGLLGEE